MYHMICSCSEDTTNPYTAHEILINNTVIVDDGPIEAEGYDGSDLLQQSDHVLPNA